MSVDVAYFLPVRVLAAVIATPGSGTPPGLPTVPATTRPAIVPPCAAAAVSCAAGACAGVAAGVAAVAAVAAGAAGPCCAASAALHSSAAAAIPTAYLRTRLKHRPSTYTSPCAEAISALASGPRKPSRPSVRTIAVPHSVQIPNSHPQLRRRRAARRPVPEPQPPTALERISRSSPSPFRAPYRPP